MNSVQPVQVSHGRTFIVFTRYPAAGAVKTRLVPVLGAQGAADVHAAMTRHAIRTAAKAMAVHDFSMEVHFDGGDRSGMRTLYGDEIPYIPQSGNDLGERMRTAIGTVLHDGAEAVVLIGTDCPGITEALIGQAYAALEESDCVLGPACDGGYYLIGMKRDIPEVFSSVPWGTGEVRARTLDILRRMELKVVLLDELHDVDRPEDLHVWEEMERALASPMISVVVPVLNEGAAVGMVIRKALAGRNVEVVVVDGGSADDTEFHVRRNGIRAVSSGPGRALQMNVGAASSSGEILLFVHADTLLPARYDDMVRAAMGDGQAVAGAFSLTFDTGGRALDMIAFGANLRSRLLGLPYGDQAFFVKRDAFRRVGGFREVPIMEDVMFMESVKKLGGVVILPHHVTTSARRYRELGPVRTWMINQLAMAGYFLGMPLEGLTRLYRGREQSLRAWVKVIVDAWNERRPT